jgi:hypothetical protein
MLMLVSEGALRLVNSNDASPDTLFSAGRLEIYLRGQWGTVCDDGFGFEEGDVACRQLGFYTVNRYGSADDVG